MEYTCKAEDCGIRHAHFGGDFHDLETVESIPDEFFDTMRFDPQCHCGWYEAYKAWQDNEIDLTPNEARTVRGFVEGTDNRPSHPVPERVEDIIFDEETDL